MTIMFLSQELPGTIGCIVPGHNPIQVFPYLAQQRYFPGFMTAQHVWAKVPPKKEKNSLTVTIYVTY